jgi:type I restriction enzyme S subunit
MTEVGVIPEDWEVKKLGDIGSFRGGNSFPTIYQGNIEGCYPFFKVSDMNNNGNEVFMVSANNYISELTQKKLCITVFPKGSIVFAKVGAAIFLERKKILNQPSCIDNNMMAFILNTNLVDTRFIHTMLHLKRFGCYVSTTALPSLSGKQLSEITIALPPISEQQAIARVLSDTDELINALDKLIAKKRDIKKAVMQELLTGKTRLPGFSGEWEVKRLGDLFNITAGKDLIRDQYSEVADNSFPFPIYSNSLSNFGLYGYSSFGQNEAGCITVTARGTLGYACYRTTPFVAIGRLLILKPKITLNGFFISELINHCIEFASESTGVPQLTSPQISKYELSIPSPEEQQAIAQVLSDIDSEITALEKRRDKMKALKQGMMQELLTGRIRLH